MKEKKWFIRTILWLLLCMAVFAGVTVVVDPYFHFHAPLAGISYRLYEERYINDGISRHFDYDAIITGTSMTQNFKTSEFNELFDCNAVKLPYSGAGYREISESLQRAFRHHDGIKAVLWGLDGTNLIQRPDFQNYEEYPSYLYDDNPFNDVSYVWNKEIMYHGVMNNLAMTLQGTAPTTFDEYSAWERTTGREAVESSYARRDSAAPDSGLTEEEKRVVEENVRQNVCPVIEQHPDTRFYLFFTPYSVCYWDMCYQNGRITAQIEAEKLAADLLLQYDNVELYCFYDDPDLIFDLDNYKDFLHYSAKVNSWILQWIQQGDHRLTKENSEEHMEKEKELYLTEEYDAFFEE